MERKEFTEILKAEMDYATGCTEPAAIALCGAYAKEYLDEDIERMEVFASTNIIKNAMSAGIPGTDRTGISYAAAIGAAAGKSANRLKVLDDVDEKQREKAIALVDEGSCKVYKKDDVDKLYIEIILHGLSHSSKAIIKGGHTRLVYASRDDETVIDVDDDNHEDKSCGCAAKKNLTIENILEFVEGINDDDDLDVIKDAIMINSEIAKNGLENAYNLSVGRNVEEMREKGMIGDGVILDIIKNTAAGIDARMAGANYPVVTNSGSGNQGITCTIPVLSYGRYIDASEEEILKAVTLSHLMCIYIHCNFGLLSALCGAVIASSAASCGIIYLMKGGAKEMGYAINNMLGTLSGMLCDGAKPDCAMKVSACTSNACLSAYLAMKGIEIKSNEGIVEDDAKKTISNFVKISDDASKVLDDSILEIMLNKD